MRNIVTVIWMSLEHKIIPRAIMKTRFYQFFVNHYYPIPFEHWCVFCRRFTDDWWDKIKTCRKCGSDNVWELMGECNYSDDPKKFGKKAGHTYECQDCKYRWDEP